MLIKADFFQTIIEHLFRDKAIVYIYDRIACKEYESLIDEIVSFAKIEQYPNFIQVSGIPGAGKSTFCKRYYPNATLVQFDTIMAKIPQYQKDCERLGLIQSFSKWEMPARVIGYEVIHRLIEKKASFVLEHSGMNPAHIKLIEVLKKQAYHTQMQFLYCELDEACQRAKKREKIILRHTPEELIKERFNASLEYLDIYKTKIDEVCIWDLTNSENWTIKERWQGGVLLK